MLRIENDHPVLITVKECIFKVPQRTPHQLGDKKSKITWGKGCLLNRGAP